MSYLIITDKESGLSIDPSVFADQLRTQLPKITFGDTGTVSILTWRVPLAGDILFGFLHSDKATISLDGSDEAVVEFAVWYRSVMPDQYQLFLCHDQEPEMMIELRSVSTKEEILNALDSM